MLLAGDGRGYMADNIGDWLEELGLGKYVQAFVDNEVDLDTLPYVSDEALEKMGVALGARLKILGAIEAQASAELVADEKSEVQTVR